MSNPQSIDESVVWRILDANLNRAGEAVRVVEDVLRFGDRESYLSRWAKSLRHRLKELQRQLPADKLVAARDAVGDVGRHVSERAEMQRSDTNSLLAANFKRFQQSARSLEEASKSIDPELARGFEQLRYDAYSLEKSAVTAQASGEQLAAAWLYALIDGGESPAAFERHVQQLIEAEVPLLQLRDKRLSDRALIERGLKLSQLTQGTATRWIMNDRPDLCVACNAHGVHLGQEDMWLPQARSIVGPARWIGLSTHSLTQAQSALAGGANYIGLGPVAPSNTKSFDRYIGLDVLAQAHRELALPIYAIGGIDLDNAAAVFATGIDRIAVSSLLAPGQPPRTLGSIVRRLKELREENRPDSIGSASRLPQ